MSELDKYKTQDSMHGSSLHDAKTEALTALEARLTEELMRLPAPEGFADRVMAKVAAGPKHVEARRVLGFPADARSRSWMLAAAAVLIAVAVGASARVEQHLVHERRERAQAARAQQQFELAMQVTSRTLAGVQERIGRAGAKQARD